MPNAIILTMGSKRKFSDFDADAPRHINKKKSRDREYNPGHQPTNGKSKNKDNAKVGSINWLKKRVRTIERRFKAGQNLPANVQNDMERELAHHKQKIVQVSDEKLRKSMISKYHMVRFFGMFFNPYALIFRDSSSKILTDISERKKADRLAKQIRKQLDSIIDEEEIKKLKADLHTAEIDSIYCRYFPHREPYISLYPVSSAQGGEKSEDASIAAKALRSERPPMWRTIEEAANKGEKALVEIRERKPTGKQEDREIQGITSKDSFAANPKQSKKNGILTSDSAEPRPNKGKQKPQTTQNALDASGSRSDDESDGGFFEDD